MVYHIPNVGNSTIYKTVFISFMFKWAFCAIIAYVVFGLRHSAANPYVYWIQLSMALPAALAACLEYRRIAQQIQSYGATFYTLTEGGLLVESVRGKTGAFFPWNEVTEVHRVMKHTVHLQLRNGGTCNCLLEGLPEARIAEFADFAAKHAGSVPAAAELTPPPAVVPAEEPFCFSATPEQRRELADARALLSTRPWVWTRLRPALLLLWMLFFVVCAYEASYIALLISLFFILRSASRLRRPGGSEQQQRSMHPHRYYIEGNRLLVTTEGCHVWALTCDLCPTANYSLPHGTCVSYEGGAFMLDTGAALPPQLQAPAAQLPRPWGKRTLLALLALMFLAGIGAFSQSNTWSLHSLLDMESPDIPTALSLAKLPPDTDVAELRAYRTRESVSILAHSAPADAKYAVILNMELRNGDRIYALFNREARLLGIKRFTQEAHRAALESVTEK